MEAAEPMADEATEDAAAADEPAAVAPAAVAIAAADRELVLEEIEALAGALQDPEARARYRRLAGAVAAGEVPAQLAGGLATVLELSLASGRARRLHGAEHEAALRRLFFQTPAGAVLRQSAADANRALSGLAGQRIAGVAFTAQAPGVFRLQLDTDRCQVALDIGPGGVAAGSVSVEL
jgi:hypothetical protein